jgi:hypothetical protein
MDATLSMDDLSAGFSSQYFRTYSSTHFFNCFIWLSVFPITTISCKNKNQIRKFFENFDFFIFDMQTVFHFDARGSGMANGSTSFEERQGQSASGKTPPTEQT